MISGSKVDTNAGDGRTIAPRTRISRPDGGSARCNASKASAPRRNFSQVMPRSTTPSPSNAICPRPKRTARFARGDRRVVRSRRRLKLHVTQSLRVFGSTTGQGRRRRLRNRRASGRAAPVRSPARSPAPAAPSATAPRPTGRRRSWGRRIAGPRVRHALLHRGRAARR